MSNGIILDDISPCSRKPGHVVHDNLDDRREVYHLLARLPPQQRLAFLDWACHQATLGKSQIRPIVAAKTRRLAEQARWDSSADTRLTLEIFFDLWMLDVNYRVDFEATLNSLEQHARHAQLS